MTDKKKYWFKRKRYGYGWVPASVEGWLVIIIYTGIIFGATFFFLVPDSSEADEVSTANGLAYLGVFVVATFALMAIATSKGPKAKWRWGKKPEDNKDEDW